MDILKELFRIAHEGGGYLAPVFVLLWWLERQERLENKKIDEERSQRRDSALNEVKLALNSFTSILNARPHSD
jgi:hypothetical protein